VRINRSKRLAQRPLQSLTPEQELPPPIPLLSTRQLGILIQLLWDPPDIRDIPESADPVDALDLEFHPIGLVDLVSRRPELRVLVAGGETALQTCGFIGVVNCLEFADER